MLISVTVAVSLATLASAGVPPRPASAAPGGRPLIALGDDPPARPVVAAPPPAASTSAARRAPRRAATPRPRATVRSVVDGAPVVASVSADGIPSVALDAYRRAAAREMTRTPACHLQWPLLAGIGRIEADHGQYRGAGLHADGLSTPPIIGIPLTGQGTARILDTDKGRLDGDTVFDHAVGPMQFIPSTWQAWGVDANGDAVADPFNIYDATAAAADYLCAAGGDLRTSAGQQRAIMAYNDSSSYLAIVLSYEAAYAAGTPGLTIPTIAPAPGPGTQPGLPPVNPGPPAALPTTPAMTTTAPIPTPTTTPSSPTAPCEAPSTTASKSSPSSAPSAAPSSTSVSTTPSHSPSPTQTSSHSKSPAAAASTSKSAATPSPSDAAAALTASSGVPTAPTCATTSPTSARRSSP
jgi:hypothetical protein